MERAKKNMIFIVGMSIAVIAMIVAVIMFNSRTTEMEKNEIDDPELARAMNYDRVQEGDSATDSEYVEFDAFFLRDLDGDGYAEGVRGTCREIGKTDTLYMELNVVKDGYLRDGLITINGKNFYLVTSIPKDGQIAENAISDNTTSIKLNDITSGTEKLLTGIVKAGYSSSYYKAGAIGSDSTGYSKANTIVLTGTHVASDGTETAIEKVINFDVDWYGTATASIPYYAYRDTKNLSQTKEINDTFDVENNEITLEFDIYTAEIQYELNLKKSVLYGTVPQMAEIDPKRVEITGTNVTYTYDPDTREYSAQIEAETDVDGKIVKNAYIDTYYSSRYAKFHISITYPLDAFYAMSCEAFEYRLPVNAYFECYNNENIEFDNPYITTTASNVAIVGFENIVPPGKVGNFNVSIGDYVYYPSYRYLISKLKPMKIFNGISESESNDTYKVNWYAYTGSEGNIGGLTMKEGIENNAKIYDSVIDTSGNYISMMDFTKYISIGFSNLETILGEDGWLKVYDDESDELIVTFDKSNWNSYSSTKQYKYETPIRSVRIETSVTNVNSSLTIYHTKEIDDNYIIDNYTKDEFDTFRYIRTRLEGYVNGSLLKTATAAANYEASLSVAKVSVSKNAITTQETEEEQIITITTECNNTSNESYWKNGSFLIKLPNEIIAASINNVTCSNADVQIKNYEIFEEDENYYIRVNTTNDVATTYSIYINLKMTPDPRISTVSRTIEMYAINRENENYYYNSADIYDIDGDGNKTEFVNKYTSSILLVSPNALLTNQTAYDYDENGSTVIAPQIAYVEKEQRNVSINIQIRNNYSNTISDIAILGKIPFEKNEYVISESDLGSTYTTVMTDDGITVPDDIKDVCKIYYSYEEKPTRDLDDQSNGWTETPDDFGQVRSYLIILENYTMAKDEIKNFCYTVKVPEGVDYNEVSYSHYGVYFSLDTETGKYRTRTEPNKLGLMIAREFDIELVKYQTDKNKTVQGAGYSIQEDGSDEANTRFTDENGKVVFKGVLLDRTYTITETSSPAEYELSDMTFAFRTYEEDGQIVIEKLDGDIKSFEVVKNDGEDAKVVMTTEDDVKANLKITKSELDSEIKLRNGRYKLTGKNYESGVTIITDSNGVATLNGLTLGEEYILEEVKAPNGYYLNNEAIKFVVTNEDGEFVLNRIEGVVKAESIIVEDEIPCVNFEIEDEKIPTYNLLINKVAKGETTPLPGVKFRLYYGKNLLGTYESDDNGQIQLNGLYRYVEEKNVEQIYTLKEIYAPEGYAKIKDIEFYVEEVDGSLVLNTEATSVPTQSADGDNVTITVEDAKSFKLTKVDGETAEVLPGTKFAIYNIDGNKAIPATDSKGNLLGILEKIDGKEYYVVETNENGEITADLPEGLYMAVEVQASDDKYDISKISDRTYYFGIGASRKCSEAESEGLVEYAKVQPHISLGDDTDFPLKVLENGCCIYGKGSTIVKTNAVGEEEWYKTISFSDIDCVGNKILVATTSGVIYEYLEDGTLSNTRDLECTISKMEFFTDGSFAILSEGKLMYFSNTFSKIWEKSGTYINLAIRKDDYIAAYGSGYIYMYNLNGTLLWKTAIDISPTTLTIGEDGSVAVVKYTTANGKFRIVGAEGIICSSEIGDGNNEGFFSVVATRDGGYLAVGWARGIAIDWSQTESAQDIILEHGSKGGAADLFLLKYNFEGKIQWGKVFSGDSHHTANQVAIDNSGNYYIIGRGALNIDSEDTVDDDMINTIGTERTGVLIKISASTSVPEQSEIVAVNNRKEFKIITDIEEIDGVKGGTISGEDERPYETVKYGDSSTKEINIVPNDEYEIISITINGEEYEFETNEDGSYVMPLFDNVIENKNIVVKFAKSSNKLTINKTDEITGEVIPDVTFQIDQLEERADPEVDLTGLTGNSSIYKYPVYNNEVTGKLGDIVANGAEYVTISGDEYESLLGELTNNGTYYFIENVDGTYTPTNSKTYQVANGGSTGIHSVTANSYIQIDLSEKSSDETFAVMVNASCSSEKSCDYGYATITEDTTAPSYSSSSGTFMYISGTVSSENYISGGLQGGKIYYLHLGYRKDGSVDTGTDQVVINSIGVYNANSVSYNFVENDGKYESNNQGANNTTAASYIPIDLSALSGDYTVIVNATVSSESGNDYGYVTVSENTTRTSSNTFIQISGDKTEENYKILEGGKIYYLHFGYMKNSSVNSGDDKFTINSVKVYAGSESKLYNFVEEDGIYKSTNKGMAGTYARSYIPIDLTGYIGKYNLIVNADISSEIDNDYGYLIANNSTNQTTSNYFARISGSKTAKDYTTVLAGGKMYYLHMVYYKNSSVDSGDDEFRINSIKLELNDSDLYHTTVTTNLSGQAITQIPYGLYKITEIDTPKEYEEIEPIEYRMETGKDNVVNITNKPYGNVIVHHYMVDKAGNNTEIKLVDDEYLSGKDGETYTTLPKADIDGYVLKNIDGEYVLPDNREGNYVSGETIEVNYYYQEASYKLVVHHYIEGTNMPVPLIDGSDAEDVEKEGFAGEPYETEPLSDDELSLEYELAQIPSNATGIYDGRGIVVTYYYKKVERELTLIKYEEDGVTPLEGAKFTINGAEYISDSNGKIKLKLEAGTYDLTEIETPEGYSLPDNPTTQITITRETADDISIVNEKTRGNVIVHHYIDGTTTPVELASGELATDDMYTGIIGDMYATKPHDDLIGYEYVLDTDNTSGEFIDGTIEVIYYYKILEYQYTVNYIDKDSNENITESKVQDGVKYKTIINSTDEVIDIDGYNYDSVDIDSLLVREIEENNVINIYYTKRTDLSYQVNYLEKDTNKVLNPQKIVNNVEFESVINSSDEVITIDGYNYDSVDKDTLTITTGTNEINIYYTKRTDLSYQVNYLEKDTNKVLNPQKIVNNVEFESVINSSDEVIAIDGYNYDSVDKDTLTITTGLNEINIYYTKRTDLSYQVNYLEKDTNKVLNSQKIVNNVEFESVINSSDEVITIDGYNYDSVDKDTLTITTGTNEINIYYTKRTDLSYQVNYLEKDTNKVLNPQKIVNNVEFETEITSLDEVITIDGYNYDSVDKDTLTITTGLNEINIYYTKRTDLSYQVNYLEKDTNKVLNPQKIVNNVEFETEITSSDEVITIDGYRYDSVDKDTLIITTGLNEINVYYTKRNDLSYTVKYLEKGTNKVLKDSKLVENMTLEDEVISSDEI
ncbi:MAG: SpaA isopeptide-forming pilin-related protein, partial [Clostridia bacterium]